MDFLALLPEDIVINHIFPYIDLTTWIRMAAVSRPWRHHTQKLPSPPADIPWLWLSYKDSGGYYWLMNLTTLSPHRPRNIGPMDGTTIGTYGQYVLLTNRYLEIKLCNPYTGHIVNLPEFYFYYMNNCPKEVYFCCIFSAENQRLSRFAIVDDRHMHICRIGDHRWDIQYIVTLPNPQDGLFHNGSLYFTSDGRSINKYKVEERRTTPLGLKRLPDNCFAKPGFICSYMVQSCERLLMITKYEDKSAGSTERRFEFLVHEELDESAVLVPVDDLGDEMIFVGKGSSRSWSWPKAQPVLFSKFYTKNCIYFVYPRSEGKGFYRLGKYCLGKKQVVSSISLYNKAVGATGNFDTFWISPPFARVRKLEDIP